MSTPFGLSVCRVCGEGVDRRDADGHSPPGRQAHFWCVGGPDCALCGEPTARSGHATLEGHPLNRRPAHAICALVYPRRLAALPAVEALCDGIAAVGGGAS